MYPLLTGDDDAGNDAESQLREDKPEPVNALVEHRIDDVKNAVKQTRPQNRALRSLPAGSAGGET